MPSGLLPAETPTSSFPSVWFRSPLSGKPMQRPVTLLSTVAANVFMSFAMMLLLAGIFGAYYGKGRSRSIGFSAMLSAILLLAIFAALTWPLVSGVKPVFVAAQVLESVAAVGAALVGGLLAGVIYVIIVMRS